MVGTLVLFTSLVALSAAAGWIAGRTVRFRHERPLPPQLPAGPDAPRLARTDPLEGYPFRLQDVVARMESEDVVLTGALSLSEAGTPIAMLYVGALSRGRTAMIAAFPARSDVLWLEVESPTPGIAPSSKGLASNALSSSTHVPGSPPPDAVETPRGVLDRRRRLPVAITRIGADAPSLGAKGTLYEYHAEPGHAALLLVGDDGRTMAVGEWMSLSTLTHTPA